MGTKLDSKFTTDDPNVLAFYFDKQLGNDVSGDGSKDNPWATTQGLFDWATTAGYTNVYSTYHNETWYDGISAPAQRYGTISFGHHIPYLYFKNLNSDGTTQQDHTIAYSIIAWDRIYVQGWEDDYNKKFVGGIKLYDNYAIIRMQHFINYQFHGQFGSNTSKPIVGCVTLSAKNVHVGGVLLHGSHDAVVSDNVTSYTENDWFDAGKLPMRIVTPLTPEEDEHWWDFYYHLDTSANPADPYEAIEWNQADKLVSVRDGGLLGPLNKFADVYYNYSASKVFAHSIDAYIQYVKVIVHDTNITQCTYGLSTQEMRFYACRLERTGTLGLFTWGIDPETPLMQTISFYSSTADSAGTINSGGLNVTPTTAWAAGGVRLGIGLTYGAQPAP